MASNKKVTILDIANQLKLSKATVSRVLRQDPTFKIPGNTKELILKTAKDLGYEVNEKKQLHKQLKIVTYYKDDYFLDQINHEYYLSIRNGLEDQCHQNDFKLETLPFSKISNNEDVYDGVVIAGNMEKAKQAEVCKKYKGLPIVMISKYNFFKDQTDTINYNIIEVCSKALSTLVHNNHKKMIYIGGIEGQSFPKESQIIYYFNKMTKNLGLNVIKTIECEHTYQDAYEKTYRYFSIQKNFKNHFTAIFCSSDNLCIGVVKALYDLDIKVGKDISIVSINGDKAMKFQIPEITTVDLNPYYMGSESIKLIQERIEGKRKFMKRVEIISKIRKGNSVVKLSKLEK